MQYELLSNELCMSPDLAFSQTEMAGVPKEQEETLLHCLGDLFQPYSEVLVGTGHALTPWSITCSSASVAEHELTPISNTYSQVLQTLRMFRFERPDLQPLLYPLNILGSLASHRI